MRKLAFVAILSVGTSLAGHANPAQAKGADQTDSTDSALSGNTEIVVTAQRRTERLQDVPATIVVQTGEQLTAAGVTNTRELSLVTPGLTFTMQGAVASPAIRGISTQGTGGPGSENNVAIYVDGIYFPNQLAGSIDLPDIQQVEVLKGPQGTLYGRNATGGAILLTTIAPSYTLSGKSQISYGRFNDVEAKGVVSIPLTENSISLGLSAYYRTNEGYIKNIVNNDRVGRLNSSVVRGKLRLNPTDGVQFLLTGFYTNRYDESPYNSTVIGGNTSGKNNFAGDIIVSSRPYETSLNMESFVRSKTHGSTLVSTFDIFGGTLNSYTAYLKVVNAIHTDADYSSRNLVNFLIDYTDEIKSQEFVFAAPGMGPVDVVVGANYLDGDATQHLNFIGVTANRNRVTTKAFAAYVDATVNLTESFSVRGGLRYSWEKKAQYGPSPAAIINPQFRADASFSGVTPSATVMYKFPDVGNFYVGYHQGFKSGTFNGGSASGIPVQPEKIKSWEGGFKSLFAGPINFSIAAYHYNYSNIQITVTQLGVATLENAARARVRGLDFEANFVASRDISFRAGMAYVDGKFTDFPNASVNIPRTACGIGTAPCGNLNATLANAAGNDLLRAPKWTGSLTVDLGSDVGVGRVQFSGTAYISSKFFWDVGNRVFEPAYKVVNARLSWSPNRDNGLKFTVWGKNLSDDAYGQATVVSSNSDSRSYAPPRTYGVTLGFEF